MSKLRALNPKEANSVQALALAPAAADYGPRN